MAAGEVRAGRAYVELGTDESKLLKGLAAGMKRVREWADKAGDVGRGMALFGAGIAGSLVTAAKGFADAGVAMARLRDQTGLSAESLSGLARAAADNDVTFETVSKSMTALQKSIANGGSSVEMALARMGLSLDQIRAMRPDQVLSTIADRLPLISNEADRTATAVALLGRSGAEMLPVLAAGSAGLVQAAVAAKVAGQAFTETALDDAAALDDAFDAMAAAALGLRNAIGESLTPVLVPLIEQISGVVRSIGAWVRENPRVVEWVLKISAGVTALGSAIWGVGKAVGALVTAFKALRVAAAFLGPVGIAVGLLSYIATEIIGINLDSGAAPAIEAVPEVAAAPAALDPAALAAVRAAEQAAREADQAAAAAGPVEAFEVAARRIKRADFEPHDFALPGDFGTPNEFAAHLASGVVDTSPGVDVLGTFNAAAASRLGFGSGLEERQAKATEETARNTRQILDELRTGGATFQ